MSGWRDRPGQIRGALASTRGGNGAARLLAIADSRAFVRALFLASLADTGVGAQLRAPTPFAALVAHTRCTRPERLRAWLDVGTEVGELRERAGRWSVRGKRARAIAAGDRLLVAHYRSMVEYQAGPYADISDLWRAPPDEGRTDLRDYAGTIAEVSLAAAPFIVPFLNQVVADRRPVRALDVGCGTGVYTRALLDADAHMVVEAVDIAPDVVPDTRRALDDYGARVTVSTGDVRTWTSTGGPFDLVTFCNNLYYFAPEERVALFESVHRLLAPAGELAVVSLTRPGSVASAHLHLMLCCQDGEAALPEHGEIERVLTAAGYEIVESARLVPTEPFVGVRAKIATPSERSATSGTPR